MNAQIRITYRDKDNNIIEDPQEGQMSYSPETQKLYQYTNGNWEMLKGESSLGLTMYDMNKQLITQLPALDEAGQLEARDVIQEFLNTTNNHYYMLLGREVNYYTVFVVEDKDMYPQLSCTAVDEIWSCAEYMGEVKSVTRDDEAGGVEIWVQPKEEDSEAMVMYLFGYDAGVIECIR